MLPDKVDRYVFYAPVPYFLISLTLFTLILVIQQSAKFAELLSTSQFPFEVALRLLLLVVPGVLLFTVPMAALVGAAVGYSRLLNDSELTALSAGGVSTLRCLRPAFLGGALLLAFALYTGFTLIPYTARRLRQTAGEIALERLTSPVEPKSFFTGFPGKVIYVQSGDREDGSWRNIFIHWKVEGGALRLITAEGGRLNASADGIELYLRNAVVTNIDGGDQITAEKASELLLRDERLDQYKTSFVEKLRSRELSNDESGWGELLKRAAGAAEEEARREAQVALHRRLALCVSPLILALVGALTVLRVRRGGKLNGVFIALLLMLSYYLLFLAGEQLTRARILPPAYGLWAAPCGFSLAACALLLLRRGTAGRGGGREWTALTRLVPSFSFGFGKGTSLGLYDRYVFRTLLGLFLGTLATLTSVFLLFTLFELLKFISRNNIAARTVAAYLLFLTPYSALFLIPPCTFIAALVCYTLMVRRSEGVVWLGSGLSVLRMVIPALIFSAAVGVGALILQDGVSQVTNKRQNELRRFIRSGERTLTAQGGETWLSVPEEGRLYLYDLGAGPTGAGPLSLSYYEFDRTGVHLGRVVRAESGGAAARQGAGDFKGKAYEFGPGGVRPGPITEFSLPERDIQSLKSTEAEPGDLSNRELSDTLHALKSSGGPTAPVAVEIEARRATPLLPFVLTLIAAPYMFLRTRQSLTNGIYGSTALMLLFLVLSKVCQNLGAGGYLPPFVAVWAVPILFASLGLYLLTRVRT